MVSLNLQVVNTGNIGCMPLCKFKKIRLLTNAPPSNEKCPGNESKNYGMYDLSYAPETKLLTDGWMDGRTDGRQGV
jgi:hypothetical protein